MANQVEDEQLLAAEVADASRLSRFYFTNERAILGFISVAVVLALWEAWTRGWLADLLQPILEPILGPSAERLRINPIFLSAPTAIVKTGMRLFATGEIWNDLQVSGLSQEPRHIPDLPFEGLGVDPGGALLDGAIH